MTLCFHLRKINRHVSRALRQNVHGSIFFSFFFFLVLSCSVQAVECRANSDSTADNTPLRIELFHINDWHGTMRSAPALWLQKNAPPTIGGAALLAGCVKELKRDALHEGRRWLFLDAGDRFQGSLEVNLTEGAVMTDLWNHLGIQIAAIGNHDLDYGQQKLSENLRKSRFIPVCANLSGQGALWRPSTVISLGKLRAGVFGLMTPDLAAVSLAKNIAGLHLTSVFEAARTQVAHLRAKGCDLVILLSHCGHIVDLAIAFAVPGIDIIVGGHSEDHLPQPRRIGKTLIVQTRGYGSHIGDLRLDVLPRTTADTQTDAKVVEAYIASWSYRNIALDAASFSADPEAEAVIASWSNALSKEVDRFVATLSRPLLRKERSGENSFGNLICRAVSAKTRVPIAFYHLGGIRTDLPAGAVLWRNVYEALPFEHRICTGEMQGSDLSALLDEGIIGLAVTGLMRGPHGKGAALTNSPTLPLDATTWYPVAFNDFIGRGGDGFKRFEKARNINASTNLVRNAVIETLTKEKCESSQ
ncbi:MAG: bifunctional UDP-sugar hydrolase/5'-nucleotidase [Candidatus Ozemobacteraceae bacterium]